VKLFGEEKGVKAWRHQSYFRRGKGIYFPYRRSTAAAQLTISAGGIPILFRTLVADQLEYRWSKQKGTFRNYPNMSPTESLNSCIHLTPSLFLPCFFLTQPPLSFSCTLVMQRNGLRIVNIEIGGSRERMVSARLLLLDQCICMSPLNSSFTHSDQ
jgi:hypothetical protein